MREASIWTDASLVYWDMPFGGFAALETYAARITVIPHVRRSSTLLRNCWALASSGETSPSSWGGCLGVDSGCEQFQSTAFEQ